MHCWIAACIALLHCCMPDVHTAINMAGPILGPCPPQLCRCLTRQLLISSMGPNMFFPHICFARQREMTGGDFHLKEREIRNCPHHRSLYFPPNIRGNPKCPRHHHGHRSLPRQFHGNSKDNLGGHPSRVKHIKIVLGSKGRRDLLRKLGLQRSHVIRRLSPI